MHSIFPILTTNRFQLIQITENHLSNLFELFSDTNVVKFYNLKPFENESDGVRLVNLYTQRFNENLGIRWGIAFKNSDYIIGTIGFNSFTENHRSTIGFDLQTKYWNQGIISEVLFKIIDFGFNELKINRIEAEVMQGNYASEKVLTKSNFQKEGILREWMFWDNTYFDMTMYSLLRKDFEQVN